MTTIRSDSDMEASRQTRLPSVWLLFVAAQEAVLQYLVANPVQVAILVCVGVVLPQMTLTQSVGDWAVKALTDISLGLGALQFWIRRKRLFVLPFVNLATPTGLLWAGRTTPYAIAGLVLVSVAVMLAYKVLNGMGLGVSDPLTLLPQLIKESSEDISVVVWAHPLEALVLALCGLPALLISLRLSLVIPAAVTARPLSLYRAWALAKGQGVTLCLALFVAGLPAQFVAWLFERVAEEQGRLASLASMAGTCADLFSSLASMAVTTLVWHRLTKIQREENLGK